MKTGFWYKGTVRYFRACVLPEIRRCGMSGFTIAHDHRAIQSRVDGAIARYSSSERTRQMRTLRARDSEK